MAISSNVNPNFPIPGLDQSSKGFRDNFAIIKQEIESLQRTSIRFAGAISSEPFQIGETENIIINTVAGNVHGDNGVIVNNSSAPLDTWSTGEIRTASYMIQATKGTSPNEVVNIVNCLVTHANGNAYLHVSDSFNVGVSLGSVTVGIICDDCNVYFNGNTTNIKVKINKSYISY